MLIKAAFIIGITAAVAVSAKVPEVHAATIPPDTCFAFDSSTGTITDYYDNEGNDSANPACTRDVAIPASIGGVEVTDIGRNAFTSKQLTSLIVPSSVETIEDYAFYGNNLTTVEVQGSPAILGQYILDNNPLESVTYNGTSYDSSMPNDDSCFEFGSTSGTITHFKKGDLANIRDNHQACLNTAIDIPATISAAPVTAIGDYTFISTHLTSVTIPDSVTTIGAWAFYYNPLTSVTIPDSVTSIGDGAFYLNKLTSVILSNSVTNIGDSAFEFNKITSISFPSSLATISESAFSGNQLTSLTIPDSVTSIGDGAFSGNKLTSVDIQGSPSSLGSGILSSNQLNTISYNGTTYTASIPNDDSCFVFDGSSGAITGFKKAELINIRDNRQACLNSQITIPSTIDGAGVTAIGNNAFYGNMLTSATMPDSVTSIGDYAFGYNQLTSISIPNSVTSIGDDAFYANQLTALNLPNTITSIGSDTFMFNRLTDVTIPASVQSLDPTAFAGQNTWGGTVDQESDPAHDLYSDDLSVVQNVLNNMWYARLYTTDGANPNNLIDNAMSEWWWTGDINQNGEQDDSLGGHIINPASVTIHYQDEQGHDLRTPVEYTGVRSTDGSFLTNYGIVDSAIKAPLDPTAPTDAELATLAAGFAQYYKAGQTKTFSAPAIATYDTPSSKTVILSPGGNSITFVYHSSVTPPPASIPPTIQIEGGNQAITNSPTIPAHPTFSGTATPGATVVVTVHSDPITCTTTADANGNWSCTLPSSLPAGDHTVFIQVTNPDNSISTLGPYAVVVKSGAPTVVTNHTPRVPDTGVPVALYIPWQFVAMGVGLVAAVAVVISILKKHNPY